MSRILDLYATHGQSDYIGEAITIKLHCEQAAALAQAESGDEEVVLAALLHDIGHLAGMEAGFAVGMGGCGIERHEHVGADFLGSLGFSPRIVDLVRAHVSAKRYLVHKNPDYQLSEASATTLAFQGGPMGAEEAAAYEELPDFGVYLQLRRWDEAAKVPASEIVVPDVSAYADMLQRHVYPNPNPSHSQAPAGYTLSPAQLEFYRSRQFLHVPGLLRGLQASASAADLSAWVDDVASWPVAPGKWLTHFELGTDGASRQLCRAENFVDYHAPLSNLCRGLGGLLGLVSALLGQEAVLFKEKINFKLPGGAGFAAHQDTPAYIGLAKSHVSVLVCVDRFTLENGCLQVAPPGDGQAWAEGVVPLTADGIVTPAAEAAMVFLPLECQPGDVVFFSGYLPHRSESNRSSSARRGLFLTYNPLAEGDLHAQYYQAKHAGMQGFTSEHKLSFQNDFLGRIVGPDE